MTEQILITGGGGFIGRSLANDLLLRGFRVRVLDSLTPPAHPPGATRPPDLNGGVEFLQGDVGEAAGIERALRNVDVVFHLAAELGVERSFSETAQFCLRNVAATGVLLDAVRRRPIRRLIVASSMSLYGEGAGRRGNGRLCLSGRRSASRLARGEWEPCATDGERLKATPTPEFKQPDPASVYALTKHDQERLCLLHGRAWSLPVIALRFFNVYGPGQSLHNPYSGVLALFAKRLLQGECPIVFEDGLQTRDFIHVADVVRACRKAMTSPGAPGKTINVGTGAPVAVGDAARLLAEALGRPELEPLITHAVRPGDVRHCFADTSRARRILRFRARIGLFAGVQTLAHWLNDSAGRRDMSLAGMEVSPPPITRTLSPSCRS